jgi:hypothetical protein
VQRSQKKRTPAKKPKAPKMSVDSEQIELDFGSDITSSCIIGGSGIDSYTIDDSIFDTNIATITIPSSAYSFGAQGSTLSWDSNYTITGNGYGYSDPSVEINNKGIDIKEGGDIKIAGRSLTEAIDKIEERLGILHPNTELEDRWEQLKELRKQYQELEKDLLEKEKMWKILKEK